MWIKKSLRYVVEWFVGGGFGLFGVVVVAWWFENRQVTLFLLLGIVLFSLVMYMWDCHVNDGVQKELKEARDKSFQERVEERYGPADGWMGMPADVVASVEKDLKKKEGKD